MIKKILLLFVMLITFVSISYANCNVNTKDLYNRQAYLNYDVNCFKDYISLNKDIYKPEYRNQIVPYYGIADYNNYVENLDKEFTNKEFKLIVKYVDKITNRILDKVSKLPNRYERFKYLEKLDNRLQNLSWKIHQKFHFKDDHKYYLYEYIVLWIKTNLEVYKDYDFNYYSNLIYNCNKIYKVFPQNKTFNITNTSNYSNDKLNKIIRNTLCLMKINGVPDKVIDMFSNYEYDFAKEKKNSVVVGLAKFKLNISRDAVSITLVHKIDIYVIPWEKFVFHIIAHELSHNLNYMLLQKQKLTHLNSFLSLAWDYNFNANKIIPTNYNIYMGNKKIKIKNRKCIVTWYGTTSISEDFAEFWAEYFLNDLYWSKYLSNKCVQQRIKIFKQILNDLK